MKLSYLLLGVALVLAAMVLGGCSGSSSDNVYRGTWQGDFSFPANGETGTMSLSVDSQGVVEGTFTNTTLGLNGTIDGDFTNAGVFTGHIVIPGVLSSDLSGTLEEQPNGHLVGNLVQALGSFILQVDLSAL